MEPAKKGTPQVGRFTIAGETVFARFAPCSMAPGPGSKGRCQDGRYADDFVALANGWDGDQRVHPNSGWRGSSSGAQPRETTRVVGSEKRRRGGESELLGWYHVSVTIVI